MSLSVSYIFLPSRVGLTDGPTNGTKHDLYTHQNKLTLPPQNNNTTSLKKNKQVDPEELFRHFEDFFNPFGAAVRAVVSFFDRV